LYELGRNPSSRAVVVSNTHDQAKRLVQAAGKYVEQSAELREVFGLQPGPDVWRDDAWTVRRSAISKDPSLRAYGRHGPVTGARIDWLVIDDIDDYESTRTPEQRDDTARWVYGSLLGRLTHDAHVVVLATAWHPDDFAHRLEKSGWPTFRFPVENERGPLWPERWLAARIKAKREELGPFESARQLDVTPIADSERRLRQEWVDVAIARGRGMYRGDGLFPMSVWNRRNDGTCILGVDFGVGLERKHDMTALVTVFVRDDGHRELLNVEAFRAELPDILGRIGDHVRRYRVDVVVAEAVAVQAWAAQFLERLDCKVIPYRTNAGPLALDKQAEALGVELSHGIWSFPSDSEGRVTSTVGSRRGLRLGLDSPATAKVG
jgi:hypothetical protein